MKDHFRKSNNKKQTDFEISISRRQNHDKLPHMQKRVNELKWKVLHVHVCFMLKPYICLLSIRHGLGPLLTFTIACVRSCVCQNDDE